MDTSPDGVYTVGDRVERRDGSDKWAIGFVTKIGPPEYYKGSIIACPIEVTFSDDDHNAEGHTWDEVRSLEEGKIFAARSLLPLYIFTASKPRITARRYAPFSVLLVPKPNTV